jgi:hypothetical protein
LSGWGRNPEGYAIICVDDRDYSAGPLAWLWIIGEWPAGEIDHKDRDPSNNRSSSLRFVRDSLAVHMALVHIVLAVTQNAM